MTGKWHVQLPVEKVFDVVVNKRPGMPDDNRGLFAKQLRVWREQSGDLSELEKYMPVGYGRPVNEDDNSWTIEADIRPYVCLLYTSPSPRDS